jgi:hypothetical protein
MTVHNAFRRSPSPGWDAALRTPALPTRQRSPRAPHPSSNTTAPPLSRHLAGRPLRPYRSALAPCSLLSLSSLSADSSSPPSSVLFTTTSRPLRPSTNCYLCRKPPVHRGSSVDTKSIAESTGRSAPLTAPFGPMRQSGANMSHYRVCLVATATVLELFSDGRAPRRRRAVATSAPNSAAATRSLLESRRTPATRTSPRPTDVRRPRTGRRL